MRRTSTTVLVVAALGLLPGEALAAATINASPNPVHAGKRVHLSGNVGGGCQPGDQVTLMSKAFANTVVRMAFDTKVMSSSSNRAVYKPKTAIASETRSRPAK